MNDRIGGIPPSDEKPPKPTEPFEKKEPPKIEPEKKELILGMWMTQQEKKQFINQLFQAISNDFNIWAKRALEALKKLGKESRGEE